MFMVQQTDTSAATFYTTFDGILYQLPTLLKCLDVCFKITQILNLKYNMECSNIWHFIQRKVYNIQTVYDKISPCVALLENTLDKAMNRA